MPELEIELSPLENGPVYDHPITVEVTVRRKDTGEVLPYTTVHYTVNDDQEPDYDVGQPYDPGKQIQLTGNGTFTLKVFAFANRMVSASKVGGYAIQYNQLAPPLFQPPPGGYRGDTAVTLVSPTPGADIWYTIDGTDPTTSSTRQEFDSSKPIELSAQNGQTVPYVIRTYCTMPGMNDSEVAEGDYSITSFDRCEGDYAFKCKLGKGELSDYVDPYTNHFNNQAKWRPLGDQRFANDTTGRIWFQDWLGASSDKYWLFDTGPWSMTDQMIDENGNIIGYATLHACSFQHLALADAGWKVIGEAQAHNIAESQDPVCQQVLQGYDPNVTGSGEGYWELVFTTPDPTTGKVPPKKYLLKRRNNT